MLKIKEFSRGTIWFVRYLCNPKFSRFIEDNFYLKNRMVNSLRWKFVVVGGHVTWYLLLMQLSIRIIIESIRLSKNEHPNENELIDPSHYIILKRLFLADKAYIYLPLAIVCIYLCQIFMDWFIHYHCFWVNEAFFYHFYDPYICRSKYTKYDRLATIINRIVSE